jgi:hypothetical protein
MVPLGVRRQTVRMYIVETDRAAVAQSREITLRARRQGGWISLVGGGLIIGIGAALVVGLQSFWGLIEAVPGVILCVEGARNLAEFRRLRTLWSANDIRPVAMVLSAEGLRCDPLDGGSVFLPWDAVAGVRRDRRRYQWSLVVAIAPGVTAATPGVEGLDRPHRAFRYKERLLRASNEEIDRAFGEFTAGRLRIR